MLQTYEHSRNLTHSIFSSRILTEAQMLLLTYLFSPEYNIVCRILPTSLSWSFNQDLDLFNGTRNWLCI